ncbi:MAG: putative rane protein [Hyphomicrobiales bacterium]|nr:putative rane protein [Hyphomicrobiales bacterium]
MTSDKLMEPASEPSPRKTVFYVMAALILVLASAFRFWDLSAAPLWMDEAFTVLAARLPLRAILLEAIDNHPPLSYAIQALWTDMFPALSLARVPAALEGVLTVLIVIAAMRDLVSRQAALWSGALLAVLPGHIWFSQDARMYPLLLLGLAVALWGAIGIADGRRRRYYAIFYVGGGAIAIYSHFVALVFLAALNVALCCALVALPGSRHDFIRLLRANAILFVVSIPWFVQLLAVGRSFPGLGASGGFVATAFFLRNAIGFPSLDSLSGAALLCLLVGLACVGGVIAWRSNRPALAVALVVSAPVYVVIITALNVVTPILATRVFLPLVLPLVMLVGAALGARRAPTALIVSGLILVGGATVATIVEHPRRTKHDAPRTALSAALDAGYAGAPIINCHFLNATAYVVAEEELHQTQMPVITLDSGVAMRFDSNAFQMVRMSMSKLRSVDAEETDRFIGGGYIYKGGLTSALQDHDKAIVIAEPCPAGDRFAQVATSQLEKLGFRSVKNYTFAAPGRPVMERGESEMILFERNR